MRQRSMSVMETKIEEIIDNCGLDNVIAGISAICYGKAAHLRENWQDNSAAAAWDRAAKRLDSLAASNSIARVSF